MPQLGNVQSNLMQLQLTRITYGTGVCGQTTQPLDDFCDFPKK